jgi:hypothetical protein
MLGDGKNVVQTGKYVAQTGKKIAQTSMNIAKAEKRKISFYLKIFHGRGPRYKSHSDVESSYTLLETNKLSRY